MLQRLIMACGGLALILNAGGCGKPAVAPAAVVKPATTTHPVTESKLNIIELTDDAVHKLDVRTAVIEKRSMRRARSYGAEVVLPAGASVIVSAPLAGTLQAAEGEKFVQVGQSVTEGRPLCQLVPLLSPERGVLTPAERIRFAEVKNTIAQSRIDAEGLVQQATVQVDAAKIALARAERLLHEKVGTVRAVDEAQAQLQLAEKALAAAQARKQLANAIQLDEEAGVVAPILIPSPMSGTVRTTQVRSGELIAAGAPLCEVTNDELLWIKVPVYVGDVKQLALDQPARVTLLDGQLSQQDIFVKPLAVPATSVPLAAAVDLYYELPNSTHAYQPGQKVAAHLQLQGDVEQSAVPWSAVIHDIYGSQWIYEQTGERQFVRRRVEVGWVEGDWAVMLRGPPAGTTVVIAGAAELAGTEFGFAK